MSMISDLPSSHLSSETRCHLLAALSLSAARQDTSQLYSAPVALQRQSWEFRKGCVQKAADLSSSTDKSVWQQRLAALCIFPGLLSVLSALPFTWGWLGGVLQHPGLSSPRAVDI